jgi:hypothetical protein
MGRLPATTADYRSSSGSLRDVKDFGDAGDKFA